MGYVVEVESVFWNTFSKSDGEVFGRGRTTFQMNSQHLKYPCASHNTRSIRRMLLFKHKHPRPSIGPRHDGDAQHDGNGDDGGYGAHLCAGA